jgi:hypothetical protein
VVKAETEAVDPPEDIVAEDAGLDAMPEIMEVAWALWGRPEACRMASFAEAAGPADFVASSTMSTCA